MMQIMKKSRAFLMAAVLILQLILLPLAEVGRASASEVSDQLVFMQGQGPLHLADLHPLHDQPSPFAGHRSLDSLQSKGRSQG